MPFLPPNQQRQSTEGKSTEGSKSHLSSIRVTSIFQRFYRVVLGIMGLCPSVSVSVSLSVTSRSSTKTAKRRITQTTPHDSPGTLVPTRRRRKPAGIDMERNYVAVTLCIATPNTNGCTHYACPSCHYMWPVLSSRRNNADTDSTAARAATYWLEHRRIAYMQLAAVGYRSPALVPIVSRPV